MQQINFIGNKLILLADEKQRRIFLLLLLKKKKTPFWIFLKILLMYCINNGKSKDNQFIR